MPDYVHQKQFKDSLKLWKQLEILSTDEITRLSEYKISESLDELSFVEEYDIKDKYGDTVSYSGSIKDGKMHGIGRYYTKYGEIFEGQFKNGKRHGYLRFIYDGNYHVYQYNEGILMSGNKYNSKGEIVP